MNWFASAKRYYDLGIYSNEDVAKFVEKRKITEEQYKEITGVVYIAQT